jgi:Type II secretion system (T2SS), protein G
VRENGLSALLRLLGVAAALAGCSGGTGRTPPYPPPPPRPDLVEPTARLDLLRMERAIRVYAEDRAGRLPASLEALREGSRSDGGRPYLGSVPVDPWGSPYSYAVESPRHGTYDLRSYGADRLPGTADDVVARSAPVPLR